MDNKELGADPALVNGAAKSVSTLTGFDQGERVAMALHEAFTPYAEYSYPWGDPLSSQDMFRALAGAAIAAGEKPGEVTDAMLGAADEAEAWHAPCTPDPRYCGCNHVPCEHRPACSTPRCHSPAYCDGLCNECFHQWLHDQGDKA